MVEPLKTFTPDVARNSNVYEQGKHYGVPGLLVDGTNPVDVAQGGKAVIDYIRQGKGPAILQVHTFQFNGHSPANPEHERGRKDEKAWARITQDPIKAFTEKYVDNGTFTAEELKEVMTNVKESVVFADKSPMPPVELGKKLEFPDCPEMDYNTRKGPEWADEVDKRTSSSEKMETIQAHIAVLRGKAKTGEISIGDAINLAVHEEMGRIMQKHWEEQQHLFLGQKERLRFIK
jgi:2-oxoisovalerate dehydrogenase E1 component